MKTSILSRKSLLTLALTTVTLASASAQISYTTVGATSTQNFNTLPSTVAASNAWTNNSTLPGWFLFNKTSGGTAITSIGAETGSTGNATFNSYGVAGTNAAGDRALGSAGSGGVYWGSPASGTIAGWMAVAFTNNTVGALTLATIGFDGEQWRNAGNTTAQTMVFEYGFGSSFTSVASWTTPGSAFNFTSKVNTATAAALDGNASANRTAGLGGDLTFSWASGTTLWLRWNEVNDSGNDHSLAVDDFSFTAVPEPSTYVGGGLLLGLAAFSQRKRLAGLVKA